MEISDEERHEVAERLMERERGWRKMGTHLNVMPDMPATQFEDVAALLGFSGWVLDADVFARLVGLIEPQERTCKIEGTYDDEYGIYDHLTCGHVAMRQWPEPTNYCPHCGARVVQ